MKRMFWIISLLVVLIGSSAQASNRMGLQQPQSNAWSYLQQQSQLQQDIDELDDELEVECPICGDFLTQQNEEVLNCGHSFCTPCMKGSDNPATGAHTNGWLNEHANCPMCRALVTTINGEAVTVPLGPNLKNPLNHVFNFDVPSGREIIAPQYRQRIKDFVRALTPAEYTTALNYEGVRNREGHLEHFMARTYFSDPEFLPLDQRIALFRDTLDLPMRSDYQGPMPAVLSAKFEGESTAPEADDLFERNQQRHVANEAAFYARYPEARDLPYGEFLGDYDNNDDNASNNDEDDITVNFFASDSDSSDDE